MNTFLKSFFVCFIALIALICYKLLSEDSYSPELNVAETNPVFSNTQQNMPQAQNTVEPDEKVEMKPPQKYIHNCYFFSVNGKLIKIDRELSLKPSLENSIALLLKGPTIPETRKGIYSEIPANVDLINVTRENNKIIVNLSSNFGNGGGTQSVENRIMQLSKTVKLHAPKANVYLYINGKEVEYLGGEGVYVKQPLD